MVVGDVHDELDRLLARAALAVSDVDPKTLTPLAVPVFASNDPDPSSTVAGHELRRLNLMFSDLVGSTSMSGRLDLETYVSIVSAYKRVCTEVIEERFGGHVLHTRGDGILAVFGYPVAHDDDALRAVKAGLGIHDGLAELPASLHQSAGAPIQARVGVHRGLVFLEAGTEELYGLAANVAARVEEATDYGKVGISDEVRRLVEDEIETVPMGPRELKGVDHPLQLHHVVGERVRERGTRRHLRSPMVGREKELAELKAFAESAVATDAPRCMAVVGEGGYGKSRLVAEFVEHVRGSRTELLLEGSAFHQQQGMAGIRAVLSDWAGISRTDPVADQLARLRHALDAAGHEDLLSLIAPVVGIGPEAGYQPVAVEPSHLEPLIQDAVHRVLRGHFSGRPGLLIVEDLHWLDPQSVASLNRLVVDGPPGLVVIVTSRPGLPAGFTVETTTVHLGPLSPDDCAKLAVQHRELSPEELADVVTRSDGIPLFIEELVRAQGESVDDNGARSDLANESVPATLYQPLSARLNSLGGARFVASAAAAIGRDVDLDLLGQVSGIAPQELDFAVSALVDNDVFEFGRSGGRQLRFRHELVRRVAYSLEPESGRRRFHAVSARSLTRRSTVSGADWSVIAEHRRRAGQYMASAVALHHAADDARRRGSLKEARENLDRALEAIAAADSGLERDGLEVQLRLARSFIAVSAEGFGSEPAAQDYLHSLRLFVDRPASVELFQILVAMWGYYIYRSDLDRAQLIIEVLRPLCIGDRLYLLPTNEAAFGMIEFYRGHFDRSAERLSVAAAGADLVSSQPDVLDVWALALDPVVSILAHHALSISWVGDHTGGRQQIHLALKRCADLPFPIGPFSSGYVHLLAATIELHWRDYAAASSHIGQVLQLSAIHGFDAWALWGSILKGLVETRAVAGAAKGIEIFHRVGGGVHTARLSADVADLLMELGDRDAAHAAATQTLQLISQTGAHAALPDLLRIQALTGPDAEVEHALLAALETARTQRSVVTEIRIATDLARINGEIHRDALRAALDRLVSGQTSPTVLAAILELGTTT